LFLGLRPIHHCTELRSPRQDWFPHNRKQHKVTSFYTDTIGTVHSLLECRSQSMETEWRKLVSCGWESLVCWY
jgi:hypothetical protein